MKTLISLTLTLALAAVAVMVFAGPSMAAEKLNAGDSMYLIPDSFIPTAEPAGTVGNLALSKLNAGDSMFLVPDSFIPTAEPAADPHVASVEGSSAGGLRTAEGFTGLHNGITDFSGRAYDDPSL
jgi:hypothetical protein